MKTVAFFNNKGGVGKTSLVYHLSWMFADMGVSTLAVDLDPQSNLTSMFLSEERLVNLWENENSNTISDCLKPQMVGTGDIKTPHVENLSDKLGLLAGNLALSKYEDELSSAWGECFAGKERGFRITSAIYRAIMLAVKQHQSKIVLIDVGPNLGAINRAALIAADSVVVPLAPDLYSLQGLKNLGPTLRAWRANWNDAQLKLPNAEIPLPEGKMNPIGYIVMQHSIKDSRPVKAYQRWLDKIPKTYREYILDEHIAADSIPNIDNDPCKLAALKHYRSLMALAQEANKPIFHLKPADGAIGAHVEAVKDCGEDFKKLAKKIATNIGLPI